MSINKNRKNGKPFSPKGSFGDKKKKVIFKHGRKLVTYVEPKPAIAVSRRMYRNKNGKHTTEN